MCSSILDLGTRWRLVGTGEILELSRNHLRWVTQDAVTCKNRVSDWGWSVAAVIKGARAMMKQHHMFHVTGT
jgi:hypothetical protein